MLARAFPDKVVRVFRVDSYDSSIPALDCAELPAVILLEVSLPVCDPAGIVPGARRHKADAVYGPIRCIAETANLHAFGSIELEFPAHRGIGEWIFRQRSLYFDFNFDKVIGRHLLGWLEETDAHA
jgi:hypothetical protein